MPATLDEVKEVIKNGFPTAEVEGIQEENHRVLGSIVWEGFKDMDYKERNRLVTLKVRDTLGYRGMNVGVLFPLAPGETL